MSARLEHLRQQPGIRSESAACDCMNGFDNGGVNRCVQLELPSHIYHIPVDEFDFGSSPTADGVTSGLILPLEYKAAFL
jgi:hypothetical protein